MKLDQPAPGDESTHDKIERYKQRFPGIVMNIFAAWLCLSALAWIIPAIGRSYWAQHPGGPAAYVWLGLCHRRRGPVCHRFSPYCKIAEQKIETFVRSDTLEPSSAMNENAA